MSSVKKDSFISSFPVLVRFISLFFLIALARTPNITFTRSYEKGNLSLVVYLTRKASSFLPLCMTLAVGFYGRCFLSNWGSSSSIPIFLKVFIVSRCWVLSNVFLHLLIWYVIFLLSLLMWVCGWLCPPSFMLLLLVAVVSLCSFRWLHHNVFTHFTIHSEINVSCLGLLGTMLLWTFLLVYLGAYTYTYIRREITRSYVRYAHVLF